MEGWLNFPKRRRRRPVSGGVRAKSRRGEIGESCWSRRFLGVMESLTASNRLSRGRSYARSGQVSDLAVRATWVTARVQGSTRKPYDVWIQVPRLPEARWDRVEEILAGQASLLAPLLAGEIRPEIEDAFAAAGVSLLPGSLGELAMQCSCPDNANPCKHVAATFYVLAEAFDRDPFLIFAWRGRDRETLLAKLRERRAQIGGASAEAASSGEGGGDDPTSALPLSIAEFWGDAREGERLTVPPRAREVPDALLRGLEPAPVYPDGSDPSAYLSAAYHALTAAAERRARGEEWG
jgi:uncharacterized Zn finger protein